MGFKLPFVGRIFWKILPAVFVLAFLTFFIAIRFFGYELTNADIGGSIISGVLLAYLLHLWMLPADQFPDIAGISYLEDEEEDQDDAAPDTSDDDATSTMKDAPVEDAEKKELCPACGAKHGAPAKFCRRCGTMLRSHADEG